MLEAGVDLLTISKLLGHSSFITTMIYLHVRQQHFDRAPSPIDWLPVRQCPKWAERNPAQAPDANQPGQQPVSEEPKQQTPPAETPPTDTKARRRSSGRKPTKRRRKPGREESTCCESTLES